MTGQERIEELEYELIAMRSKCNALDARLMTSLRALVAGLPEDRNQATLRLAQLQVDLDSARGATRDWYAAYKWASAEREVLIAKIGSMANERDMFAAKVNQDMSELLAATAEMVRAINRKSFLDVRR